MSDRFPTFARLWSRLTGGVAEKAAVTGGTGQVERRGAGTKGTLYNWVVNRLSRFAEARQRITLTDRAEDLVANDPHAVSCIESMTVNVVGTGLLPQSKPVRARLGIKETAAAQFAENAEWIWKKWARQADAAGVMHFSDILYVNLYSMLMRGEYLVLPVMRKSAPLPGETAVRLALRTLHPSRLSTPSGLTGDPTVRDGIRVDTDGRPRTYYIANPADGRILTHGLGISDYMAVPAKAGHRPGVFHGFFNKHTEQVRGVSILAPAMKFFRDLGDYLDFEVVGNIIASSLSVFIEKDNAYDYTRAVFDSADDTDSSAPRIQEVVPGSVMYGKAGEKPHMLSANRPGPTFEAFVRTILRAMGAAVGLPYEVVAKDFSNTNYSSARAALLEAWRVYMVYRSFIERRFATPIWCMVLEEAWLRDELVLPAGGPKDFYSAMAEYCEVSWIGPARGHVDPVKEMDANIKGLENNIFTLADLAAEHGKDWEAQVAQRVREKQVTGDNNEQTKKN